MIVGYARVSTIEQHTERQEIALQDLGCEKIFIDKQSGKTLDRPEFNKMMDFVREGDTLIVSEYNRLSRSTKDLLDTVEKLEAKGVTVKSIKENLDTSTPTGKLMLTFFAGLAEFERTLMLQRQAEGIERAKLAGKYKGRPANKYDEQVLDEISEKISADLMSISEAARILEVTRATVYKMISDNRLHIS